MTSLRQIAASESAFVASIKAATAAVNAVATVAVDAALAELRAALAAANERMRLAVAGLSALIEDEALVFGMEAGDAAATLAADVAAMTPEPARSTSPVAHECRAAESAAAMPCVKCVDSNDTLLPPPVGSESTSPAEAPVNRVAVALGAVDADARADFRDDCKASEGASAKAAHAGNGRARGKRRKGQ